MADVVLSDEAIEFEKQFEEAIKKIEPKNSGLVTEPDQEDFNYWNKAKALTLSAAQGVVNAVEEQGDFLDENIISLGGLEFGDNDGKFTFKDLVPSYVTPKNGKKELILKKEIYLFFTNLQVLPNNLQKEQLDLLQDLLVHLKY